MKTDVLIAGGGLAGGLVALALAARRPELAVAIVEGGDRLGGNHVWSFFDGDVAAGDRDFVDPLVVHHWPGHDVAFPGRRRTLSQGYNAIESEAFDTAVRQVVPAGRVLTGTPVVTLDPAGATLADGRRIEAGGVIDARGMGDATALDLGWQKFVGQSLRLRAPHGLTRATIMDATVPQIDGYRFMYLLPFGPEQVFVEDTYYADEAAFDPAVIGARIADYARGRGWEVAAVERQEAAALPIAMGGDFAAFAASGPPGVARIGMGAGLFHPVTGYSLPDAVETASLIAGLPDLSSAALHEVLARHAARRWRRRGFDRLLSRMLFRAAEPAERWRVMARFYGLGEGLIGRFYSSRTTLADRLRILAGRPPVPVGRALAVLREKNR